MQHALSFIVIATTARIRDTSQGKTSDAQTTEPGCAPLPFVLEHSFVSGAAEKKKTVLLQEGKARLRKKKRQSFVGGNTNNCISKDGYPRINKQRLSELCGKCSSSA